MDPRAQWIPFTRNMKKLYHYIKIELFRSDEKEILKTAKGEKGKKNPLSMNKGKIDNRFIRNDSKQGCPHWYGGFCFPLSLTLSQGGFGASHYSLTRLAPLFSLPTPLLSLCHPCVVSKFLCAIFPTVLFLN